MPVDQTTVVEVIEAARGRRGTDGDVAKVLDKTELANSNGVAKFMANTLLAGMFLLADKAPLAADVAIDTNGGLYVPSATDPTKVWIRQGRELTPYHFGAKDSVLPADAATNRDALQKMSDFFFAAPRGKYYANFECNLSIDGPVYLGPSVATSRLGQRYNCGGNIRLVQTANNVYQSLIFRNLGTTVWNGGANVTGPGSSTWSTRTCQIGIAFRNCASAQFTGLFQAYNFQSWGVWLPSTGVNTDFNDSMAIAGVRVQFCGSGSETVNFSLKATYTGIVNNGASGSTNQSSVFSGVPPASLPPAALETDEPIGSSQYMVRINGAGMPRYVQSIDRVAGTITVYPWVDPATLAAGSGTLTWIFGGGVGLKGPDSGLVEFGAILSINCGIGYGGGQAYGSRVSSLNATSCGSGICLGNQAGSASHIGDSIDCYYPEGCIEDFVHLPLVTSTGAFSYLTSAHNLNIDKIWFVGDPLVTSGARGLEGGATGNAPSAPANVNSGAMGLPIAGRMLYYHGRPLSNPLTVNANFRDQKLPPANRTFFTNSQTITLETVSLKYNELFGYSGTTWLYIGTGPNGAPTGNLTFVPPAGGSINGGAADANLILSGFTGPVAIAIFHSDAAQLSWKVWAVSGQAVRQGLATASGLTVGTTDRLLGRDTAGSGAIEEISLSGGLEFTGAAGIRIADGGVTLAKQANMATASVVYRKTAGAGPPEVQSLATLKTDLGLSGTNSGDQFTAVTSSRLLGRITAGFGAAEELSGTQATSLLDVFDVTHKGLVPAPTASLGKFLKDDGTWATITDPWTVLKLGADFAAPNSVAFADVTDGTVTLTFTPPANTDWEMEGKMMLLTTAAANLPRIGLKVTGNAAQGYGSANFWQAGAGPNASVHANGGWNNSAADVNIQMAAGGFFAANIPYECEVAASGRTGATPTAITIQLACETAGANVCFMKRGSFIKWKTV